MYTALHPPVYTALHPPSVHSVQSPAAPQMETMAQWHNTVHTVSSQSLVRGREGAHVDQPVRPLSCRGCWLGTMSGGQVDKHLHAPGDGDDFPKCCKMTTNLGNSVTLSKAGKSGFSEFTSVLSEVEVVGWQPSLQES